MCPPLYDYVLKLLCIVTTGAVDLGYEIRALRRCALDIELRFLGEGSQSE
jgi:hypothetical protein